MSNPLIFSYSEFYLFQVISVDLFNPKHESYTTRCTVLPSSWYDSAHGPFRLFLWRVGVTVLTGLPSLLFSALIQSCYTRLCGPPILPHLHLTPPQACNHVHSAPFSLSLPPNARTHPHPNQYSPRACELVRSEPSPRSSASAPWTTWRRTERSASLWPRPQTQDPHPSCQGGASAGCSTGSGPDADAARLSLCRLASWPFSWFSTAAVKSGNAGSAIWAQWAGRLRREPPYRASPTPGAPSPPPEASHPTRSRWKYQNRLLPRFKPVNT